MAEKKPNRRRLGKFMTWGQGLEAVKKKAGRNFKQVKKTVKGGLKAAKGGLKAARDARVTIPTARGLAERRAKAIKRANRPSWNERQKASTHVTGKSRTWREDPKENRKLQQKAGKDQKNIKSTYNTPSTKKTSSKSSSKSSSSGSKSKSNVFTKHYKTGKALGVMTRSERRAYDKEAAGRTFEGQVKKHHESSGSPSHLKETKYKSSVKRESLKAKKRKRKSSGYQYQSPFLK